MYIVRDKEHLFEIVQRKLAGHQYWHEGKDLLTENYKRSCPRGHLLGFTTQLAIESYYPPYCLKFGRAGLGQGWEWGNEDWEEFLTKYCTSEYFNRYMDAKFKFFNPRSLK